MEDEKIIELYFARSGTAIEETRQKYGAYCTTIAYNILANVEDTEECVSDAYLHTWNAIPPTKPKSFRTYLGKITHNLALTKFRRNNAQKRSGLTLVLDELQLASLDDPVDKVECKELSKTISEFIRSLSVKNQRVFVLRYWYFDSISNIASKTGMTDEQVKAGLYRMRKSLRRHLEQEGYFYD